MALHDHRAEEPILRPGWIGNMSYEAELAFIMGAEAKNVPASEAMRYVAGYTCVNDLTARDIQKKDIGNALPWMQSKNFDTFCPMGPCVLLSGAVKEPVEIGVQSRVNGVLKQDGNTRDLIFDIPTVIEYITKIMTLEPGDCGVDRHPRRCRLHRAGRHNRGNLRGNRHSQESRDRAALKTAHIAGGNAWIRENSGKYSF